MEGTLTTSDAERGFGFITYHDHGTRRAFLHVTEIRQDEIPDIGDRIRFDLMDTPKGVRAVNVALAVARLEAERLSRS